MRSWCDDFRDDLPITEFSTNPARAGEAKFVSLKTPRSPVRSRSNSCQSRPNSSKSISTKPVSPRSALRIVEISSLFGSEPRDEPTSHLGCYVNRRQSAESAATAQSAGPITTGILRQNDGAGYGVFRHFSYQHVSLGSPAHERSSSSISRSSGAQAIGGGLEGRPRQSSIFRIACGG